MHPLADGLTLAALVYVMTTNVTEFRLYWIICVRIRAHRAKPR